MKNLKVGDSIPEFVLEDADGQKMALERFKGAPFILYFYPKDNTPGCTKEACSFQDTLDSFKNRGVLVVGVSPDGRASHQKFRSDHHLSFPLLSDPSLSFAKACGVSKDNGGVVRTTFLVNQEGKIVWMESPVNVQGHVERVLIAVNELLI